MSQTTSQSPEKCNSYELMYNFLYVSIVCAGTSVSYFIRIALVAVPGGILRDIQTEQRTAYQYSTYSYRSTTMQNDFIVYILEVYHNVVTTVVVCIVSPREKRALLFAVTLSQVCISYGPDRSAAKHEDLGHSTIQSVRPSRNASSCPGSL
jgi:hypothetical protein